MTTMEQEHELDAADEGFGDRCRANERTDRRAGARAVACLELATLLVLFAMLTFAAARDSEHGPS
jgi:hypothetical protein